MSIASGVKDKFIERLQEENTYLRDDRQQYIDRLIALNRRTGQLEGLLNTPALEDGEQRFKTGQADRERQSHAQPADRNQRKQSDGQAGEDEHAEADKTVEHPPLNPSSPEPERTSPNQHNHGQQFDL